MYFSLFTLSQNKTSCNHECELARHTWKMSPHYLMKCRTHSPDRRYIVSLQTLVALKRAGYVMWQLECQASNVTATIVLRGHEGIIGYLRGPHWGLHRLRLNDAVATRLPVCKKLSLCAFRVHSELISMRESCTHAQENDTPLKTRHALYAGWVLLSWIGCSQEQFACMTHLSRVHTPDQVSQRNATQNNARSRTPGVVLRISMITNAC